MRMRSFVHPDLRIALWLPRRAQCAGECAGVGPIHTTQARMAGRVVRHSRRPTSCVPENPSTGIQYRENPPLSENAGSRTSPVRLVVFLCILSLSTAEEVPTPANVGSETPGGAQLILESRRKGPPSDSDGDRELWREANPPNMRLVWATTHGDLTESIRALEQGADPNLEDVVDPSDFDKIVGRFRTPLKLAVMRGDHAIVSKLLGAGADVNLATQGDRTALMMAVESQDWYEGGEGGIESALKSAAMLVEAGVDFEQESEGMTALALAAAKTGPDAHKMVSALLEHGASVKHAMPLILAAHHGNAGIAHNLLDAGADPDAQMGANGGALLMAASYGKLKVVKALLEFGADPDIKNKAGRIPLKQAILQNHLECARALVNAGAYVDDKVVRSISLGFPQDTNPDGSSVPSGPSHLLDYVQELQDGVTSGELPKSRRGASGRKPKRRKKAATKSRKRRDKQSNEDL